MGSNLWSWQRAQPMVRPSQAVDVVLRPVDHVLHVVLLGNRAALEIDHVIAIETGGDLLVHGRVGQQIAGELLDRELGRRACSGYRR